MRTITTKAYTFDELSEEAKQKAIEAYRMEDREDPWVQENKNVLKAFEDIFPVKVTNWEYGYQNFIDFKMNEDDEIAELSGIRLLKYIINNYYNDIFKGKYYSTSGKWIEGKYHYKYRHSNIQMDTSCVLTGYCIDDDILKPIYDFLKKPEDHISFNDLMYACLQSWIYACRTEYEAQQEDNYITDYLEANEYEFDIDGNMI